MNFNNNFEPTLKDLVYGQKKINDNISKKFLANDKILESLAGQLEGINFIIKNQLSFNKMIETQVAQVASSCPNNNSGKLPGQPEVSTKENVSVVTKRTGKSTQEPLLALLSLNELLRKCTETDVAFTLEYARVSNPRGTIKHNQTSN